MEALIKQALKAAWGLAKSYVQNYVNSTETPWDNWAYEAINDIIEKYVNSEAPAE